MKLEFLELNLEWPAELNLFCLKNYILSKLMVHGEPLRWAITSITNHSKKKNQIISVEVVFIVSEDKSKSTTPVLN